MVLKNASLVDYALDDIIRVDYYRFKLLKTLGKLVEEEYRLSNYGLASQYAVIYLKLYKRVIRDYVGDYRLNTKNEAPVETDNSMKEFKYLSPKYLDRVLNTYINCRQFLVSGAVKNIVSEINQYLPYEENWEVFTSFQQIYEADGKWGDSNYKVQLVNRYHRFGNKLLNQYSNLNQMKTRNQYSKLLNIDC